MVFYGLRPSELIFLFHKSLTEPFLDVTCVESLGHMTKGRRNKRLPMFAPMYRLLRGDCSAAAGLILHRREVFASGEHPLWGASLDKLVAEFEERCRTVRNGGAQAIQEIQHDVPV